MLKAIYLFYLFKFAPSVIDNKAKKFWQKSVDLLNKQRSETDGFYLFKIGRFYVRDPHAWPDKSRFSFVSKKHPFCWRVAK